MTKYQDEMYKFITSTENFEAVCDLVDEFPLMKQRLLEEFWLEVRDSLQREIMRFEAWKIWNGITDKSNPAITIYRDEFCFEKANDAKVAIRIEHLMDTPWYGLFVNRKMSTFDFKDIWAKATELKLSEFKIGRIDGWWWPLYQTLPYNFTQTRDIQRLMLPERENLIKEIVAAIKHTMDKLAGFAESYFIPK